jgi:glycosyl transferase family 25
MSNVLMLEDDVTFASTFPPLISSVLSQLEIIDWDFCYLGHEDTGDVARANRRTSEVNLVPYEDELRTTHFYLVNRRVIPRLVAHLDRLAAGTEGDPNYGPMPVDGAINRFRQLNTDVKTIIADPKLAWQRPSRSDISPKKFDELRFLEPVTGLLRNLKHMLFR